MGVEAAWQRSIPRRVRALLGAPHRKVWGLTDDIFVPCHAQISPNRRGFILFQLPFDPHLRYTDTCYFTHFESLIYVTTAADVIEQHEASGGCWSLS